MKKLFKILVITGAGICLTGCNTTSGYDSRHIVAFSIIGLIAVLFLALAKYSNLIRDEISDLQAFNSNAAQQQLVHKWMPLDKTAPFSLTKVQFGLWTVIISSVYIYLSLLKGDCAAGTINKTALVLMGIFAGTAVASTIMDKNEMNDNRDRHQNAPSQGFFVDILSDDNGISLHRFQNFAWTIIAITVYLYKVSEVAAGCELPELSDTLLALTGISSVTYLTLKSKENDPPAQQIPNNGTATPTVNPATSAQAPNTLQPVNP
ncbi:hypothetical protein [Dyadobacter sp. NIV53]|uniref:hypothetical protein n=1 Tax=Dyadobacter sp. NIV53 TaxID=2861765 RepID=UPI001C886BBC|nr:hypothetical protein [Dyadobacter sp. NIV53]